MPIDMQALAEKWPREQFLEIQSQGFFHASSTYDDYLEMRREQAEMAEAARLEGLTGVEFPEKLEEEDFAILYRYWDEVAAERKARESQVQELESVAA
ncbi:MAG: hypothetical protein HOP19_04420 [Acidobacteria bacterium]|nr:hypothetical protein [Acidobacteriota bacterium]